MPRRYVLPLLLAYPLLAIAGAVTHRQIFPLLALLLLLTAVMLPRLQARRAGPWLVWLGMLLALLLLSLYGFAGLLLETVPVLINALLACWFGGTLRTSEPLVTRFIVAIEGADRLSQPGVARYARQVTWFWTLLLATQAVVLAVLLLCAGHSGLLARFGIETTFIDGSVIGNWEAAMRPNTRMMFLETPSNPTLAIFDMKAIAAVADRHGARLVVDNAFASPAL